mmetsp:Transcript_6993/g.11835  ORF Transcript_6993/g.11835 Transcript_6993/m.11835 type:complete len:269 (-) Transcript_6993:8-814(-)
MCPRSRLGRNHQRCLPSPAAAPQVVALRLKNPPGRTPAHSQAGRPSPAYSHPPVSLQRSASQNRRMAQTPFPPTSQHFPTPAPSLPYPRGAQAPWAAQCWNPLRMPQRQMVLARLRRTRRILKARASEPRLLVILCLIHRRGLHWPHPWWTYLEDSAGQPLHHQVPLPAEMVEWPRSKPPAFAPSRRTLPHWSWRGPVPRLEWQRQQASSRELLERLPFLLLLAPLLDPSCEPVSGGCQWMCTSTLEYTACARSHTAALEVWPTCAEP